jgi:hypothetical protein
MPEEITAYHVVEAFYVRPKKLRCVCKKATNISLIILLQSDPVCLVLCHTTPATD